MQTKTSRFIMLSVCSLLYAGCSTTDIDTGNQKPANLECVSSTLGSTCSANPVSLPSPPWEVSGITVDRDRTDGRALVLVADEHPGVYFSCKDDVRASSNSVLEKYFEITDCVKNKIANATVATDFESIAMIRSGEYLILSETLRALIVAHGDTTKSYTRISTEGQLKVQYENSLSEVGGRGLEGVALRSIDGSDNFELVALWEGGYPEKKRMLKQLGNTDLYDYDLKPVLIYKSGDLKLGTDTVIEIDSSSQVEVEVPVHIVRKLKNPMTSYKQRFRAPDLVWAKTNNSQSDNSPS